MNKKIIAVFFLILALTFTGCGKSEEKQAEDILKIAYTTDPQGLDPHRTAAVSTFNVTGSIYETLLAITPDWEVQPRLAESYEISPDGMEITFKLREGVLFHNGREMKAEDVKNSFERLKGEESPKAKDYANIKEINVLSDYEISFATEKLDVELAKAFIYPWTAIIPIEDAETLKSNPVGTGAYKFKEWIPQQQIILTANEDYYLEPAIIKELEFKLIPDATSQMAALQTGDIHLAEIQGNQVEVLKNDENLKIYSEPMNAVQLLALNLDNEIFKDVRVRRAIAMAINNEDINSTVVYGYGSSVGAHLPVNYPDYYDTNDVIKYNPEEAKKLLAEAGYGNGLKLEMTLPKNYQIHMDAGQVIADQLSKIGITAEIKVVEWGQWLSDVYSSKDYEITVAGLSGRLDSYYFLKRYHSKSGDFISYITGEIDPLLEASTSELDPQKRKEIFKEIQVTLAENVPVVYLQTPDRIFALAKNIEGFRTYPIDIYEYKDVFFK